MIINQKLFGALLFFTVLHFVTAFPADFSYYNRVRKSATTQKDVKSEPWREDIVAKPTDPTAAAWGIGTYLSMKKNDTSEKKPGQTFPEFAESKWGMGTYLAMKKNETKAESWGEDVVEKGTEQPWGEDVVAKGTAKPEE